MKKLDLANRIEELGQTTIEAIEHAVTLVDREDADALVTLPIMSEVMEAYSAIGEALPFTSGDDQEDERAGTVASMNEAFFALVKAYEQRDREGVRCVIKDEVLPLYKNWFDSVQWSLPHVLQ